MLLQTVSCLSLPSNAQVEAFFGFLAAVVIALFRYGYLMKRETDRIRQETFVEPVEHEQPSLPFKEDEVEHR